MYCTVTALCIRSTVLLQVSERWEKKIKNTQEGVFAFTVLKVLNKVVKIEKKKCQTQGPTEDGTDNRPIIPCF